jgi:hypothetical protein
LNQANSRRHCTKELLARGQYSQNNQRNYMNSNTDFLKKLKVFGAILLAGLMFTACERKGPAEKVGESIDEAAEGVRDAFER